MDDKSADAAVLELMLRQRRMARVQQLYDLGLSKDQVAARVKKGLLQRLGYGLVGLPDVGDSQLDRAMLAVMAAGPDAVCAWWTAAELHGLTTKRDDRIHVVVEASYQRRKDTKSIVVHRTRYLPTEHRTLIEEVPVTTVPRTIVDCSTKLDRWSALRMLDSAHMSKAQWNEMHRTAVQLSNGRSGVRAIADATGPDGSNRFRSMLERHGDAALTRAGLPAGEWNVGISDGSGHIREVDLCFRDARLIVEIDGLTFHRSRKAMAADRVNDRRLQLAGWRVLRFTWTDVVDHPTRFVRDVRIALAAAA